MGACYVVNMVDNNKSFYTTMEAKISGPIEVKSIILPEDVHREKGKQSYMDDGRKHWNPPIGPYVPIKNKDPPLIIEEHKDDSNF